MSKTLPRVLIIGQGLTGSIFSFLCYQNGIPFLLVDQPQENSASRVAGGLWHPMAFRNIKKVWEAEKCIFHLEKTYLALEEFIGKKIRHPLNVIKIFPNAEYANDFHMKAHLDGFDHLLSLEKVQEFDDQAKTEAGYGLVKKGGRIDLLEMIQGLKREYIKRGLYVESEFKDSELEVLPKSIEWKGEKFDKVVFCRGSKEPSNSFFSKLPLGKTKGDILTIELKEKRFKQVVNNGKFMIPIENNRYIIGSTYYNGQSEATTDAQDQRELIEKMEPFIGDDFKLIKHEAGIRPTVKDRKPLVGWHETHVNIGIINGMGSRGVMLAPYVCEQMLNNMINGAEIPNEINTRRYY